MHNERLTGMAAQTSTLAERDPLLDAFLDRGIVLFGQRVEREYGLKTPVFVDLRQRLHEDIQLLAEVGEALHRRLREVCAERECEQQVIGIPDTATPLALAAAMASRGTEFPLVYGQLRKRPANYPGGDRGQSAYMGTSHRERDVTLIDDVMASGRTKAWASEELARDGISVTRVLVVVDRQQGATAECAGRRLPVDGLYRLREMIAYYARTGQITAGDADAACAHLETRRFGPDA